MKHLFVILTSLSFVVGETNFPSTAAFSLEENGNKVRFQIPELEILETGDFQRISSKITGTTTDPGYPELPIYTAHISTDPAREYSFNYTVVNTHLLEDVSVFPFQSTEGDPLSNSIAQVNAQFYQSSEIYPLQNMIVSSPQSMRGLHLVQVSIIPFKFDPKTQTLEVWDEVEISMTDEGPNTNEELRQMPRSRIFEQLYDGLILDGGTGTPRDDDKYQQPAILYVCGGSSESSSYFQQLVDWRSKRGYVVYSAPTSETGNSASQIKNYIQNAYDTYDPPPEYVCLVGDVGGTYNIPTFAEEFGHNDFGSYCEGDHPFSQLDGTDLLPEVLIGRISIRSSAELGVVVNKIINYEKATYLSQISSYYEKAALAGDPYDSGVSCAISKEYVAEVMNSNGMDDIRLKTSGSSWSSWMRNQLDEGVLYFNYRGYVGVSGFDNGDIDAANNGYKLPFASVLTCGPGSFAEENTCLSEKFLRAGSISNPKGGIAAIATATWNTHTLFNNIVDMGIYDGIFSDGVETAGAALAKGKLALYMTYPTNPDLWVSAFTHWNNLMGDPATHLWSDTPQELFVEFPASINYGTNLVDITVIDENNNPVEDAMVTLFDVTQDSVKTRPTAGTGMVTFSLPPSYTNDLSVTVTKKNYKPFEGAITIVNNDINLSLSIVDEIIIDDSNGNSDGLLNPGEMINLQIPVSNLGVSDAENISAVISSTSDVITIEQGQSNYELIPAGESIYGGNFTITVSLSAVDRENLGLRLNMQDTSNEWVSYVPVRVNGSNLVINGTVVEGDGELNPGSIEDLSIVLFNDGMLTAENVSAELIYDGNLIDIISNNIQWISVDPQSTVQSESSFQIDISSDVINGTVIPIALHIFNDSGYDQVENLALQVGNVSVTDPLGPDQYGYYIYDSGDVGYEHTPVYNWIEIDPTYGGAGTALNIDDYGDGCAENQTWWCNNYIESEHVELPFSFQFYGVEYNEITISSNGWIAFGNSEMESFRNYPIPGAGGPTAMVAAFWDDLKTTSGGDVLFYADPGNDYFIIEWSDMRTYASNSWEDFQIILYNNPVPPFGDGEIKIQYKTFNNTSAGNYSAYPPIHGGYATIGTENQYANDGLQYTYDNEYPAAGMELDDGDAILITTNPAISMPMPSLSYTPTSVDFQLNPDETGSSEMVITNVGDEGSILEYAVSKEGLPPFDVIGGGPDEFDNIWSDSELEQDLNFEWIDISGIGTELSFSHNDEAADPIDLEFEFPFYGETYSQCIVNPNGWIGFGEDNTTWQNQNIPVPSAPRPAIFGLWDDLDPLQGGAVYYHSNSQRMVVWFDNVVHYPGNTNGVYNFQIVLFPNGDIQVNYLNISGADNSQTVGIQNGDGTIGLQVVYNDDYVDDNFSLHIKQLGPIDWLELESETGEFSGELNFEESVTFSITANSGNLPGGEYGALIKIETETSPIVELPVIMTIAGNFPPVASDDNYAIDEDYLLEISVEEGVLANDNDSDGDVFTAQLMDEPVHGSLTLNSDGSFSYEPELNFYGEDSFTYTAVDSNASNVAMVVIIVNPVNDLPGMFNLVSPSTDSVIVITPDNQEEILTFSWHEAENVDNDEITYNLDGTEGFSFLSEFIDLEENEYQFTYGELAEAMGDEDIVTADWNVSALDDEFTVLSENGPFTLTIDKSSLGISEPFIPEEFALYQNYPNPFNPVTTITYDIPEGTIVNLTIYDVMGRVVKTLVNEWNEPGRKAVMWNGIDEKGMSLTSGIYIYRINTSGFNEVKKLILLK